MSRFTTVTHVFSELFARKLLGRTDIEDALKRLDSLIQEEFQMVTAQILKVATELATEVKDGTRPYRPVTHITLNTRPPRCRKKKYCYAADVEQHGRSQA
jgi:hypothetical protein